MFLVLVIGSVPGIITSIALPSIGIFTYDWGGFISAFGWIGIMSYSVIKQNQMNVKTVYSELLVVGMILLMFIGFFAV
jgi:hypothetical protein